MISKIKNKIYSLLRRSEKYTKTDMVYLASGGFWLTSGQIVSSAAAFLLAIAFANLLPKETYGVYKYVLSIAGMLAIPTLWGMGTAISQAAARGYDNVLAPAVKTQIKWGLWGGLLGIGTGFYYYLNNNPLLSLSFFAISIFIPFMDPLNSYTSLLLGKKLFKKANKYEIIARISATILIIAALLLTKNIILLLLVYFGSHTLLRLIFFYLTLKQESGKQKEDKEVIKYGKHLSLVKGINLAAGNISNIFLFHFIGSASLAIYSFAIAPMEQLRTLIKIADQIIFPKIAKDNWSIYSFNFFIKKISPFIIILSLISLTYIFIAPLFFKLFFPQYIESVFYSQLYALTIPLTGINSIQDTILKAKRETKKIYLVNIINSISVFIIYLPMIYLWGILGLVWAVIIGKIIEFITYSVLVFRISSAEKTE
ncbi:MAG: oligosaccharide flippase family protein [Patescibacteria group bacterium]|nr:oligosaccharide flippase family protein [Patescibacteria group bacterium]